MTLDFIVLGLPRSGTTWAANWLTTDQSLCLHDPFAGALPEHWPHDHRRRGISCTAAYLMPRWLALHRCPVVVIERDPAACAASLARIGLGLPERLQRALAAVQAPRVAFEDLWVERRAQALWKRLLPGVAFDAVRYRQLREMRIEPRAPDWTPAVVETLMERGWLVKED